MTSLILCEDTPMLIADFRDSKVLVFTPTNSYIGYSKNRNVFCLCKGPIRMVNGVLCADEDIEAERNYESCELKRKLMKLASVDIL